MTPATIGQAPVIACVAGLFPARTETFIYREVRALRERGWRVLVVSLALSHDLGREEFVDLANGIVVLYGPAFGRTVVQALVEMVRHPLRSVGTLALAARDALAPGEPLGPGARAKLLAQGVVGLAVAHRLRRNDVRHIHCHFAHAPATVGMYAARQLRLPFSFTGHANDLFERRALLGRKLERAAFVGSISAWHRALYDGVRPGSARKAPVIRCGVDVGTWEPVQRGAAGSGPLRVLTVCRLVEKKGVDELIEALAELGRRHGRLWELTVAGDGPLRGELEALARRLGCEGSVRWLGEVGNAQVRSLMVSADLFVLPCRVDSRGDRDGIPVALVEAMSCGLPVISGDLPAIRELVEDGVTGLVHGGGASALADRIVALDGRPGDRRRLGEAGRRRVEAEFSQDGNIDRLEGALREFAGVCR